TSSVCPILTHPHPPSPPFPYTTLFRSYIAGSTRLNNVPIADSAVGISPVVVGLLVNGAGSSAGVIEAGAVALVTFQVRVSPTQTAALVNTATIDPDGPSGPQSSFTQSVTTPVTPAADLSVIKSGPASGVPGTTVTYT